MGIPLGSARVVVGFTTKKSPFFDAVRPEFKAPTNYRDQAKIAEYTLAKSQAWEDEEATLSPNAAVIESAHIVVCKRLQISKAPTRTTIECRSAVDAADFLVEELTDYWDAPEAPVFLGFHAKQFLRILAMETSMPGKTIKLPYNAWYGEGNTRELLTALCPSTDSLRELRAIMGVRGLQPKGNWTPHDDAAEDMRLSLGICSQLGLI